jgi:hypothetical protein
MIQDCGCSDPYYECEIADLLPGKTNRAIPFSAALSFSSHVGS